MAMLLGESLTLTEKVILANMTLHEGWKVLQKLMNEACTKANEAVIKLDPADTNYDRQVKVLQSRARNMNEFCLSVLKSASWQVNEGMTEEADRQNKTEE